MRLNLCVVPPLRFFFTALVFLLLSAAPVHAATIERGWISAEFVDEKGTCG